MAKMKLSILFICVCIAYCNGETRIAGGQPTTINEYPIAAALLTNRGGGSYQQACGGTIISNSAILSAASCFFTDGEVHGASSWRARVGTSQSASGGTIYLIRRITPHPDFNPTTRDHNLAVIRTTFTITLQGGVVEAAHLVGGGYSFTPNQVLTAIGWGEGLDTEESTTQLRHVQLWRADQQVCAQRYSALGATVTDNMVCAGWIDVGGIGQCEGDVGSPLLDSEYMVVGVFSWAEGCAHLLYPGVNTRVAPYVGWIVSAAVA